MEVIGCMGSMRLKYREVKGGMKYMRKVVWCMLKCMRVMKCVRTVSFGVWENGCSNGLVWIL